MTLGADRMSARAEAASTTAARADSSSLRHVVPLRLTSVSQPTAAIQASSRAGGTPAFRKSWKLVRHALRLQPGAGALDGVAVGDAEENGIGVHGQPPGRPHTLDPPRRPHAAAARR